MFTSESHIGELGRIERFSTHITAGLSIMSMVQLNISFLALLFLFRFRPNNCCIKEFTFSICPLHFNLYLQIHTLNMHVFVHFIVTKLGNKCSKPCHMKEGSQSFSHSWTKHCYQSAACRQRDGFAFTVFMSFSQEHILKPCGKKITTLPHSPLEQAICATMFHTEAAVGLHTRINLGVWVSTLKLLRQTADAVIKS